MAPVNPADAPEDKSRKLRVDWDEAFAEERKALGLDGAIQPAALCLSGGGVRSAALCLGVLRSLADQKHALLQNFHYLSTVSGGGYIGSWLTRFIADQDRAKRVISDVSATIGKRASEGEAAPVRQLRRYTRFLAPQAGLLSLDTLAGILLWIRNTLVNWLVFLPIFGAAASLPLGHFALTAAMIGVPADHPFRMAVALAAFVGLVWGAAASILYLPSHYHPDPEASPPKDGPYGIAWKRILALVVVPMLAWCVLVPLLAADTVLPHAQIRHAQTVFGTRPDLACPPSAPAACPRVDGQAPLTAVVREALRLAAKDPPVAADGRTCRGASPAIACARPKRPDYPTVAALWRVPAMSAGACLLAYLIAFIRIARRHYTPIEYNGRTIDPRKKHIAVLAQGILPWLAGSVLSCAVLWAGIALARDGGLFWLAIAGPLWVGMAETLRTTVFVALRHKRIRGDLDREWLARISGAKLLVILAGTAGGAVVVVGGSALGLLGSGAFKALAGGGLASGGLVAWIGRSAATVFTPRAAGASAPALQLPLAAIANVAVIVFGATLFALIGHGIATLIGTVASWFVDLKDPEMFVISGFSFLIAVACASLALGLGLAINLNRFSMHAVYRNRLTRAFLGAARRPESRHPDSFTGFDPADNLRMADTFDRPSGSNRLLPVINVALNSTVGEDPARAERKAVSFTITPLRCGSAALDLNKNTADPKGAYVRSDMYAGDEKQTGLLDERKGISLGTAITISGAAASPNMGYHSTTLIASVMTLFNVRLGAWLPNPAVVTDEGELGRAGPRNAVRVLLSDLLGLASLKSPYIYLSDGGHFDNLGIYEMLRRRCGMILAIDAGQDQHYAYEDLTRTIEYARIDLGAEITFLPPIRVGDAKLEAQGAFAEIRYRTENGRAQMGRLIYLKAWLPPDAPVELLAMQKRKASFPHESTLNQFFTESDFESYRRLGEYLMDCLIALPNQANSGTGTQSSPENRMEHLFDGLERLARRSRQDPSPRPFDLQTQAVRMRRTRARRPPAP
jgi:hypothetical protein